MIRKIVKIDEDKCNGCGLCIGGCHEGALKLIDGKAKLITDSYCDGLGACLPACPTDAISIIERDAAEFDEEAVAENMAKALKVADQTQTVNATAAKASNTEKTSHLEKVPAIAPIQINLSPKASVPNLGCGCPGSHSKTIERKIPAAKVTSTTENNSTQSHLRQWPVQIKLVPANAPYFDNCHLLVAADCTAYSYANFHNEFMKNKITVIGCPKLDDVDYAEKLTQILKLHEIKSLTVIRMEVPCCGGIVNSVKSALSGCGKLIPWNVITISTDGSIIEE